MSTEALLSIPVGVVVERHKAANAWLDFVWRPASVLSGVPAAAPWTPLASDGDSTTFFAGTAAIDLYRTETASYLANLASGAPLLWVVLRATGGGVPYELAAVTADPAEGEALTEAGSDLVETVPMSADIREAVEAFIAEHHVERQFLKQRRDSADPGLAGSGGKSQQRRR